MKSKADKEAITKTHCQRSVSSEDIKAFYASLPVKGGRW